MLTLHGNLRAILRNPAKTLNDGRKVDAYDQIQLEVQERLESGQIRFDVVTLTVDDVRTYQPLLNAPVAVPVRAYGRKTGGVGFIVTGEPEAIRDDLAA
jgi:hypothetical protein